MYIYSSTAYLTVMEYSNIVFTNNKISNDIISFQPFDQSNPYMFCGFQYVTLNNASIVSSKHYNITFHNNLLQNVALKPQGPCQLHFHHFTTHCRWIPTSVFYGYNPGVINQQIIQTDQPHQLINHHTIICYCSHNITNCSVDVLGPVYPGQVLQVELCASHSHRDAVLYVETHNTHLPTSACKIAQQTELIQTISTYPCTFKFTIVTENKERCKLFLTASPCLHHIFEAYYVEILPCPVGFTLHNGICDCDPYLSNSNIHITLINQLSHVLLTLG